eukprot:5401578-Amphidinium_carterae.1
MASSLEAFQNNTLCVPESDSKATILTLYSFNGVLSPALTKAEENCTATMILDFVLVAWVGFGHNTEELDCLERRAAS